MFGIFYFEHPMYKEAMDKYYKEHPESTKLGKDIVINIVGWTTAIACVMVYAFVKTMM